MLATPWLEENCKNLEPNSKGGSTVELQPGDLASFPPGQGAEVCSFS